MTAGLTWATLNLQAAAPILEVILRKIGDLPYIKRRSRTCIPSTGDRDRVGQ